MQFLYPNVLFLLILLAILIFLISTNKDNMQRFFDEGILNKLIVNNKSMGKLTRNVLFFISLILFILALSRPVMDIKEQKIKQKLIPIVVALDVSKSMQVTDIYPSRLSLAKKKLKHIIELSQNSMIGIVLFAKNSFIVSPVTEDFTSLSYIVDNLDTSLNFENGSNIFAVLEATTQMLKDFSVKNLIILSDGGNNNEYIQELEFAKENKINIYTVGLATKAGAPIPDGNGYLTDKNGDIVTVSLNESIKNLALNSGGGYIDFSLAYDDVEAIINQIQKHSKKEELDSKKIKTYTELFYYPLGLAIFCLLIAFSSFPQFRKNIAILYLAIFIVYPQDSFSSLLDFKILDSAKENYAKENYKVAIENYEKIKSSNERNYNLANSYYKNGEFKKAISSYEKIVTPSKDLEYQKLHNLGNSYVKTKELQKAKEFYEKALKLKDDKETKENLEAVKKALEKDKKQNKKDKNKKEQNKDNKNQEKKKDDKQKRKDNKENSKDKEQKNKDKKGKDNQKKDSKQDKNKGKKDNAKPKKSEQKSIKKQPISDMEEKKWLKALQNKKAPIMLQQIKSKKTQNNQIEQPW